MGRISSLLLYVLDLFSHHSCSRVHGDSRDFLGHFSPLPHFERFGFGAVSLGCASDAAHGLRGGCLQPAERTRPVSPSHRHGAALRTRGAVRTDSVPAGILEISGSFLATAQLWYFTGLRWVRGGRVSHARP